MPYFHITCESGSHGLCAVLAPSPNKPSCALIFSYSPNALHMFWKNDALRQSPAQKTGNRSDKAPPQWMPLPAKRLDLLGDLCFDTYYTARIFLYPLLTAPLCVPAKHIARLHTIADRDILYSSAGYGRRWTHLFCQHPQALPVLSPMPALRPRLTTFPALGRAHGLHRCLPPHQSASA